MPLRNVVFCSLPKGVEMESLGGVLLPYLLLIQIFLQGESLLQSPEFTIFFHVLHAPHI